MNTVVFVKHFYIHTYWVNALQIKVDTFELSEYNLIMFLTKPKLAVADKAVVLNGLGEVAVCRTT